MRICCLTPETQTRALEQPREVGAGGSWVEVQGGGDTGTPVADSC